MSNTILKLALKIAQKAHEGQFRRDGFTPYLVHPIAIANSFPKDYVLHKSVALLHDVVEDSDITLKDLLDAGMPQVVVDIVNRLTKKKLENYLTYILQIKKDRIARDVKIADIKHNLSTLESNNKTMKDKYELALYILTT